VIVVMRFLSGGALCALLFLLPGVSLSAERDRTPMACDLCDGMVARMSGDASQPFILRSFEPANGGSALHPALENTGFTYDNAVAMIALVGCNRIVEARRIADALVMAVETDRHYHDGRLRNAYRSGPVEGGKDGMLLPGYWNAAANSWTEDGYQVGSATGSTAWGALALLMVHSRTQQQIYLDTAAKIMNWIHRETADPKNSGYFGGVYGHEPTPQPATWKSTEHNLDVYAVNRWLATVDPSGDWENRSEPALRFLQDMWDEEEGRFHIGSVENSNAPNRSASGLDAELWPLIGVPTFIDKRAAVMAWTEKNHGLSGGFDFNDDRDGIWLEGTAQAALVYRESGQPDKADALFDTIAAQMNGDKLIYATIDEEVTTGLQVGPDSSPGDFKYFRLPHIGATGWAALAALKLNPFIAPSTATGSNEDPCRQKS
jgi:hypothetical protein